MAKPPKQQRWDIVPMEPKGSTKRQIFHAVGSALSSWENMEFSLSRLYDVLLDTESYAAVAAFGMIASSAQRREMIKQVLEFVIFRAEPEYEGIKGLLDEIGEFAKRRDEIAHGFAVQAHGKPGWYLTPSWYHTKKSPRTGDWDSEKYNFGLGRYVYTANQIAQYDDHFRRLNEEVQKFVNKVAHRLVPEEVVRRWAGVVEDWD